MPSQNNMLTLSELTKLIEQKDVDTVIMSFTDMQGRLVGKRVSARLFIEDTHANGAECCNYLLAVDVDMNTVDGYQNSSWETGYGDMVMRADMSTLRIASWLDKTAIVTADLFQHNSEPVEQSPREILKKQLARLEKLGYQCLSATELEFMVFDDTYRDAWKNGYTHLTPASDYNIDYAIHASSRMEPLLADIRRSMDAAGMYCEGVKGECNLGQQEIAFRYANALTTCDNHSLYKSAAKEIADTHGKSLTFMAKFNEREGNSCHIHMSLRSTDGDPVFSDTQDPFGMSDTFKHFIAGQLACMREFSLLYAPNINSYKRYAKGSFAPTTIAWGRDNRSCALRVVGHGLGMRVENRVPGGDVNPYLANAAMIAAGLYGIENQLTLPEAFAGNAYKSERQQVPKTLSDAEKLFSESTIALDAFGKTVVDHYVNYSRVERENFDSSVTDWERFRGFERL